MRGSTFSRRGAPSRGGPARPGHRFLSKRKRWERKAGGLRPPWPPQYGGSWRRWAVQTGQRPTAHCRPPYRHFRYGRCRASVSTHRGCPASPGSGCAVPSAPAGPPPVPCRRNTGAVTAAIRRGDLWSPAPSRGGVTALAQAADRSLCRKRQSSFPPRRRPSEAGPLSGGRHVWRPYGLGQRISAPGGYPVDGESAGKPEVGAAALGGPFRPERSRAAVGTDGRPLVFCTYLWYTLTK